MICKPLLLDTHREQLHNAHTTWYRDPHASLSNRMRVLVRVARWMIHVLCRRNGRLNLSKTGPIWVTLNFYPKMRNYRLISLTSEGRYWAWRPSVSSRLFLLHFSRPLVLLIVRRKIKELVLSRRSAAHDVSQVMSESCGLSDSWYRHVSWKRCGHNFQGSWMLIGVRPRGS